MKFIMQKWQKALIPLEARVFLAESELDVKFASNQDGSVRLFVDGDPEKVQKFIERCEGHHYGVRITWRDEDHFVDSNRAAFFFYVHF